MNRSDKENITEALRFLIEALKSQEGSWTRKYAVERADEIIKKIESQIKLPKPKIELDYSKVVVEEMEINTADAPDFCDSYIVSATYDGREMSEEELDVLNSDSDFVYQQIEKRLY